MLGAQSSIKIMSTEYCKFFQKFIKVLEHSFANDILKNLFWKLHIFVTRSPRKVFFKAILKMF